MSGSHSPDELRSSVLRHTSGSLLVTGGAGTGKSSLLRERFTHLVRSGADPDRLALVVGSKRAHEETRAALLQQIAGSLPGLHVWTIHGLAYHVVTARHAELGYPEPPDVLSAADQFALVHELLAEQDRSSWPAYGRMLGMRGFTDEIRQFLSRAQESLLTPEEIEARAEERGLSGWRELAAFLREYQDVVAARGLVDFAGMVLQASVAAPKGDPLFEHVLVDDYQDTTLAAEELLLGLDAPDLVVAGDPAAHVFSFQGTTPEPIARFADRFRAAHMHLEGSRRAPEPIAIEGWAARHTSEEYAAIARELRRLHVADGVAWDELAVIVRRQGSHLGGLLRALDDARVPRAVPESGLSLTAEPATFPYTLALRWLARPTERDELVESVLTSDLARLSPAVARGLMRAAQSNTGRTADALSRTDGLSSEEASTVAVVGEVFERAERVAGRSVLDAFAILWRELPYSSRLVEEAENSADARRELDAVVAFADVVAAAGVTKDPSVEAFLETLDEGTHGPGYAAEAHGRPEAVQVLTAHGAVGREFDTVVVAGAVEGNFPSLSRPEPMFDLAVLEHPVTQSERNRLRLEDERRLFRVVLGRARRRAILTASEPHDHDIEGSSLSRFAGEMAVGWTAPPEPPYAEPVSAREATAVWRRALADRSAPAARRLAALEGLVALGVDPGRWWFQRGWTDPGDRLHDHIRVSYSKLSVLENCELQYVLSAEVGLGKPVGYQAWVGKTVHRIIEDCEKGLVPRKLDDLASEVDARWRPQEFPSRAVSEAWRSLAKQRMLPNWFERYGPFQADAPEGAFEFEYDGATINGVIDRIGPDPLGYGTRITDYKTGSADYAPKANESLQLGIYYLAVQEAPELEGFRPITGVELAYLKGDWRDGSLVIRDWPIGTGEREAEYQRDMRARLSENIAHLERLNESERYRPNAQANCWFCEFRTLCPLWPEGAQMLQVEDGA